jgi:hypothetical protein
LIKDISVDKIEFLPISKDDLILSLDRLTRFKYPENSYYRVITTIICKYLKSPSLSKNDVYSIDVSLLKQLFTKIWNDSVFNYSPVSNTDYNLNKFLLNEIQSTYILSDDLKRLVDLDIDIISVLGLLDTKRNLPINLRRLIVIKDHLQDAVELRKKHALRFPVEKVVLCEGITEEILLPEFAKFCGCDFDKQGIKLISAGGKNQVAKLYYELKNELNVPIFVLLDADAIEVSNSIKSVLRLQDMIYLIDKGEFEDIFSLNLIKRTINNSFRNICECSISDIKQEQPMVKTLTDFYRIHELGDFQKSEFARELANNLKYDTDITQEILALINSIVNI